ncbi:hypothetical protein DFJ74DRAFT_72252 [Hyaloraphidium curvatum]|nr:hypothetical protein DFJ74DRAFT_72252 [Hyaloraphidium curvatum]
MSLGPRAAVNLAKKLGIIPRAKRIIAQEQNGVGGFVVPCTKMTILYTHPRKGTGLAARHVVDFVKRELPNVARANPSIEFCVQATPNSAPMLVAEYIGGLTRQRQLKGLDFADIRKAFFDLRAMSGKRETKYQRVITRTPPTAFITPWGGKA